ncbi:DUF1580 domain-containing protein [Schlesneria sp. T3-172]|uniref:DUF1580 domain-containing protein n=1 Tax=Schlesneria sphaerica TaxID=3373610 RepID=UPI0037CABC80
MTIDTSKEALIAFSQARDCFPGRRTVSLATLHRWRLRGVRGVKLETCLVGDRRFTTRQAISRFIEAQNPELEPVVISSTQRRTQAETANRILAQAGI